jgi:hypothetical protein
MGSANHTLWTRSKQPWVILPDGGTLYETQPDRA